MTGTGTAAATSRRTWLAPLLVLIAFVAVALGTYAAWDSRGVYSLAGDEPHYLAITRGLVDGPTLDQLDVYELERSDPQAFAGTAIPLPATPDPVALQSIVTDAGWQSIHSPGLSVLLIVPFAAGGADLARLALILLAALCVPLTWWAVRLLAGPSASVPVRVAVTAVLTLSAPLLFSSGQVYPDVAAGLALLLGLTTLLAGERVRGLWVPLLAIVALCATPWLQLKFALPALIVAAALAAQAWRRHRALAVAAVGLPLASLAGMAAFHLWLYGSPSGPYGGDSLVLSPTSVMVMTGLLLDQDQGALLLSPVLWAALPGIVLLWRARWRYALVWLAVLAAVVIPNASHPNWYGGGSFIGRFAIPAILLLTIPAALALLSLAHASRRAFAVAIAAAGVVLAWMWVWFALISGIPNDGSSSGLTLYNRTAETWLGSYSMFWYPVERWLPALYDVDWAYAYAPNWAWLAVAVSVIVLTVVWPSLRRPRLVLAAWAIGAAGVVLVSGLIGGAASAPAVAESAPLTISRIEQAFPDARQFLRNGTYALEISYASPLPDDQVLGRWDLVYPETGDVIRSGEIRGTSGATVRIVDDFAYRSLTPQLVEPRITPYRTGDIAVDDLRITDLDSA